MTERDVGEFNLERYLSEGVRNLVGRAFRATLKNPKESAFLTKYLLSMKKAEQIRRKNESSGLHVPPFLIASITSACNLHCAGCYSRANHACDDATPVQQMSDDEWDRVFCEAKELGIGFILLAGGEPTLRYDVIMKASRHPEIIFPIFTNGTMIDDRYMKLFDAHRNLVPIISIEGNKSSTDLRRGDGAFDAVLAAMRKLKDSQVIFGASVTQTAKNIDETMSDEFIDSLEESGVKIVFYVEYVPIATGTEHLAPGDAERSIICSRISTIRKKYQNMLFLSFPGDEKSSGGCLAAGRGFFHINSHGGAEPCPFSPYSEINLRTASLREAINSDLFIALQNDSVLSQNHMGGCVLYEHKDIVESLTHRKK